MSETIGQAAGEGALHEEHVLLGARFRTDDRGIAVTVSYASSGPLGDALHEGALLADLTGMGVTLVSGHAVSSFQEAAFAGSPLAVGESAFEAVLLGDGAIASVPLVARTGWDELLALDRSSRSQTLSAWLSFVAGIEQGGFRPYDGLSVEDVHGRLVPLALWGRTATAVLGDYVGGPDGLPGPGHVANLMLDGRISCLAAAATLANEPIYLTFVPPALSRVVWRSILSFRSVRPTGSDELWDAASSAAPWLAALRTDDRLVVGRDVLAGWGVLRPGGGHIGARGLSSKS